MSDYIREEWRGWKAPEIGVDIAEISAGGWQASIYAGSNLLQVIEPRPTFLEAAAIASQVVDELLATREELP